MKEHFTIKPNFDYLPLDVIIMSLSHPRGIIQIAQGIRKVFGFHRLSQ